MKLTVLKILALLALLLGIIILGVLFDVEVIDTYHQIAMDMLLQTVGQDPETGAGGFKLVLAIAGLLLTIAGFYGFVPKLPKKSETITFQSDNGEVTVELDRVAQHLRKVLLKMDEVKQAKVFVKPGQDGKEALISAKAMLIKPEGVTARETAKRVHRFITQTAKEMLGLEELAPINLQVRFAVNPKASGRALREAVKEEEAKLPPAVMPPDPPISEEVIATADARDEEEAVLASEPPEEVEPIEATPEATYGAAESTDEAGVPHEIEPEEAADGPTDETFEDEAEVIEEEDTEALVAEREEEAVPVESDGILSEAAVMEEEVPESVVPEEEEEAMPPLATLLGGTPDPGFSEEPEPEDFISGGDAGEETPAAADDPEDEATESGKEEDPKDADGDNKWSF